MARLAAVVQVALAVVGSGASASVLSISNGLITSAAAPGGAPGEP